LIELVILIAIAGFVLYRLKSVIGTRTGYEAPPDYLTRDRAEGAPAPVPATSADDEDAEVDLGHPLPESAKAALAEMRAADPDFSIARFVEGARSAYEMILMAYEAGDRDTLRGLLERDVADAFEQGIAQRESNGLRVEARFIGVRDLRVEAAAFNPATRESEITLRFVGELITSVRDSENRIVEGDPNKVRRQTDVWTFSRIMGSKDPTWLLAATGE